MTGNASTEIKKIYDIDAHDLQGTGAFSKTEQARLARMGRLVHSPFLFSVAYSQSARMRPDATSLRTGHISRLVFEAEEMVRGSCVTPRH